MDKEKMSVSSIRKIEQIIKKAEKEMGIVLLKSWLMSVASIVPIVAISVAADLAQTAFPMVMGLMTVVLISVRYVKPASREIGEKYEKEVKAILEEERKRQAEGS